MEKKEKVLTVYWDDESGESKIEYTDYYKRLGGVDKMDIREDILEELELIGAEGMEGVRKGDNFIK